jgi:probable DNA metabolism protein
MAPKQMVYIHDGSFEGMLHAIAAAVKSEDKVRGVYAEADYGPLLFETPIALAVDRAQALRLFHYLQRLQGTAVRLAINGFLSEDPEVGTHLYRMVLTSLTSGGGITQSYSHDSVNYLQKLSRKVGFEAHRFEGLLRFKILHDGVQYAPFEPDCNVIGYCAQHFKNRLKNVSWILHDIRRNLAVYWDGNTLEYIDIEKNFSEYVRTGGEVPEHMLSSSEHQYQQLWRLFHTSIANKDRENLALQRQHMPRRYWKYLVESP